jgi:hypothetical protein
LRAAHSTLSVARPRSRVWHTLQSDSALAALRAELTGQTPSLALIFFTRMPQAEVSAPCCEYVAWDTQGPSTSDPDASTPRVVRLQSSMSALAVEASMRSACGSLEVRPSVITAAGLGLFAAKRYEQGELLPCECAQNTQPCILTICLPVWIRPDAVTAGAAGYPYCCCHRRFCFCFCCCTRRRCDEFD